MSPQFLLTAVVSPPEQPKRYLRREAHKNKKLKTKFKLEITALL
jgi:hypothetical protein